MDDPAVYKDDHHVAYCLPHQVSEGFFEVKASTYRYYDEAAAGY